MSASASQTTPEAIFVAGSLIDVPVSIDQAVAVSARIRTSSFVDPYDQSPQTWRIPPVRAWITGASPVTGQLEVHFDDTSHTAPDTPAESTLTRPVVVYDTDGTVLTDQAWAC